MSEFDVQKCKYKAKDLSQDMKNKAMCVVDFKPDTKVLTFWLKNPGESLDPLDQLELDTNPEIEERIPAFTKKKAPWHGTDSYMGIEYYTLICRRASNKLLRVQ